ncbi:MAG: hypothetical protein ACLQUY_12205, partial [Ktedonobacterales bacterium]
ERLELVGRRLVKWGGTITTNELTLEEKQEIILLLGMLVTLRPKAKPGPRWEGQFISSTLRLNEADIVGFEFSDNIIQVDL